MGYREAIIIAHGEAIRLKAKQDFVDKRNRYEVILKWFWWLEMGERIGLMCRFCFNRKRVTGEEWLVRQIGSYLPGIFEDVR